MRYIEITYYDKSDNTWKRDTGYYESIEQCLLVHDLKAGDRGWQINVNREVTDGSILKRAGHNTGM